MFTVIYDKNTTKVLSTIAGEANYDNLSAALSEYQDFIYVTEIPKYRIHWQELHVRDYMLVVEDVSLDTERIEQIQRQELEYLRTLREVECFSIVNRGVLWYNTLTDKQLQELKVWYDAWLDITTTYQPAIELEDIIPKKPEWLS